MNEVARFTRTSHGVRRPICIPAVTQNTASPTKRPITQHSMIRPTTAAPISDDNLQLVVSEIFDKIVETSFIKPLHEAIEPLITRLFHAHKTVFWIKESVDLFSPTLHMKANKRSLPGFVFNSKSVIQIRDASQAPEGFETLAPPHTSQLLFPIHPNSVLQVQNLPESEGFTEADSKMARMLMKKMSIYGSSLFTSSLMDSTAASLFTHQRNPPDPFVLISQTFGSPVTEIWRFDLVRKCGTRVNDGSIFTLQGSGLAGVCASTLLAQNWDDPKLAQGFEEKVDDIGGSVVIECLPLGEREVWVLALRGRTIPYSSIEQAQIKSIVWFVVGAVAGFNLSPNRSVFINQLSELVAISKEIASTLSFIDVADIIEEKGKILFDCEKCIVLLVDNKRKRFIRGNEKFSTSDGLAGVCLLTQMPVRRENPGDDPAYIASVDSLPDWTPKAYLAAPVFDSQNDPVAIVILHDKIRVIDFNENDEKVLTALNVFAGISIEKAAKYQTTIKATRQMREFVETAMNSHQEVSIKPLLKRLVTKVMRVLHARRVTFYLVDNSINKLNPYITVGALNYVGSIFAEQARSAMELLLFDPETVESARQKCSDFFIEEEFPTKIQSGSSTTRISDIFSNDISLPSTSTGIRESICCLPLINCESSVLGVLEIGSTADFNEDDISLIESFGVVAGMSLERIHLQGLARLGYGEVEVQDWITDEERSEFDIPVRLQMQNLQTFTKPNFEIEKWDGIGLFKLVFRIFDVLELREQFSIDSEKLFRFLLEVRLNYRKIAYHNWRHAVDAAHYAMCCLVESADLGFDPIERLALIVAALAHDIGHSGYSQDETEGIAIPLSILYSSHGAMESYHCSSLISVMAKPECDIFSKMNEHDNKRIWEMVIQLILSTNMGKHFDIVEKMNTLQRLREFKMEDPVHRLLGLEIFIKCSDLALLGRPLRHIKRLNTDIAEEFYEEGQLDRVAGLIFTKKRIHRDVLDKQKSLGGFFNNLCVPMFNTLSKMSRNLEFILEIVEKNLSIWREDTRETTKE